MSLIGKTFSVPCMDSHAGYRVVEEAAVIDGYTSPTGVVRLEPLTGEDGYQDTVIAGHDNIVSRKFALAQIAWAARWNLARG